MLWSHLPADDFHINLALNTELPIGCNNEDVFHFMEVLQRSFPQMQQFVAHDSPEWIRVLEEDREIPRNRWVSVEKTSVSAGYCNPELAEDAYDLHCRVLELAPTLLGISLINLRAVDLIFAFDMIYDGNHDEIVSKAFAPTGFDQLIDSAEGSIVNFEPNLTFALDEASELQGRISIETRTNGGTGLDHRFGESRITVILTIRKYWSGKDGELTLTYSKLKEIGEQLVEKKVVPLILTPLAEVIASR